MSSNEFELFNIDSPKSRSSVGKKSTSSGSWEDPVEQNREVPIHLFINCETASSYSGRSKGKLSRKSAAETSFSPEQKTTKSQIKSKKEVSDVDSILSLVGDPEESNGSDSECVSSNQSKSKKFLGEASRTSLRTNKIQDVKTQGEKKIKISDVEFDKSWESPRSRDAVFSREGQTKKTVSSASDLSYRERIRDRFNVLKEKAVESLSRPQSRSHSRLKSLMTKGGSKMEDLLRQEEDTVLAAIERHKKIKMRWQALYRSSLESKITSQDESDNFFVEVQNPISPSESVTGEESKSLQDPESSQTLQEGSKILTSEFLGIKEDWELVEFVHPKLANVKSKELWDKQLFYPSTRPISLEDKLEPGLTPRYKEEEGIFVGHKIRVPNKIKNKMECRILKTEDGRKWFGKDGNLVSTTCPLKFFPTRPIIDEDEGSTQVVLKPSTLGDRNHRYMDLSGNLNYVFDIDISSIEFTHHPLFSREHVVAQRLKELYLKYKRRKEADNVNRLNGRLNALRKTKNNLISLINQSGDNANFRDKLQRYNFGEERKLKRKEE